MTSPKVTRSSAGGVEALALKVKKASAKGQNKKHYPSRRWLTLAILCVVDRFAPEQCARAAVDEHPIDLPRHQRLFATGAALQGAADRPFHFHLEVQHIFDIHVHVVRK